LWNSLGASLSVELSLFGFGLALYLWATRARDGVGAWGLAGFLLLVLALYAGAVFGPPPPSVSAIAWTDMGQGLFIALATWIDRHRAARR